MRTPQRPGDVFMFSQLQQLGWPGHPAKVYLYVDDRTTRLNETCQIDETTCPVVVVKATTVVTLTGTRWQKTQVLTATGVVGWVWVNVG